VRGAAESSLLSANVFLARPGLEGLVELVQGSTRALRTIRRGIALSLVYNAIGVGLAATGHLNPLVAAVLMPFSSLTVVTNAYRSRSFGTTKKEQRS
jgi:cation transport ATPase